MEYIIVIFQKEFHFIACIATKKIFQDDDAKDVHAGIVWKTFPAYG